MKVPAKPNRDNTRVWKDQDAEVCVVNTLIDNKCILSASKCPFNHFLLVVVSLDTTYGQRHNAFIAFGAHTVGIRAVIDQARVLPDVCI